MQKQLPKKLKTIAINARHIALEINKSFDYNPVQYYMLTNGLKTAVYQWDKADNLIEMDFDDFVDGNSKLAKEPVARLPA